LLDDILLLTTFQSIKGTTSLRFGICKHTLGFLKNNNSFLVYGSF